MANKRIIEQTASTTISNDDWLIKDSPTDGTTKIQASVFKTLMNDGMASDEDLADAIENIAGEYDSEVEYSKDALCFKDGVLYIANADTTGTWDSTKWDATTIADIIANLRIDANDVVDVSVKGDSLVNSSKIAILDSLTAQGSASGSIASFSDGSTHPMSKLEIGIEPIQDLHGYDNPWAGGAGKNKLQVTATTSTLGGVTFTVNDDGTVTVNGTASGWQAVYNNYGNVQLKANTEYILTSEGRSSQLLYVDLYNGTTKIASTDYQVSQTFSVEEDITATLTVVVYSNKSVTNQTIKPMIRLATETDPTFEPYSNICPISGFTEANVTRCGKNIATTEIYKNNYVLAVDGSENYAGGFIITKEIKINSSNNYYISMVGGQTSSSDAIRVGYYDGNFNFISRESEYSPGLLRMYDNAEYIRLSYRNNDPYFKDIQIEVGTEATAYEPYNGNTYKVEFKDGSNPLTVYGGTLDVVSGELVVNRAYVDMGTINWVYAENANVFGSNQFTPYVLTNGKLTCSQYKWNSTPSVSPTNLNNGEISASPYFNRQTVMVKDTRYTDATAFKTAMNGVQLVYELETPTTYQLTPTQVKSLLGSNNVWCDTGDVNEAVYTRDLNTTVNDIISRIEALENA